MPLVRQAKRLNTPRFWLNPLTFVAALALIVTVEVALHFKSTCMHHGCGKEQLDALAGQHPLNQAQQQKMTGQSSSYEGLAVDEVGSVLPAQLDMQRVLEYPHVDECRQCKACVPQYMIDAHLGNSSRGGRSSRWFGLWHRRLHHQQQQQQQLQQRSLMPSSAEQAAELDSIWQYGLHNVGSSSSRRRKRLQQWLHAASVDALPTSAEVSPASLLPTAAAAVRLKRQQQQQQQQRRHLLAKPIDGVKTHMDWLKKQQMGLANNDTHSLPGIQVITGLPDNSFKWRGATYHIGPSSIEQDQNKIRSCAMCRGCKQLLQPMPTGVTWHGSHFSHEVGASPGWMVHADSNAAAAGTAAVKIWCVPVPKPGSHVPAVCKPEAIRQQLHIALAVQGVASECGLDSLLPRHWVAPVDGVLPSSGFRVSWDALWADLVVGISAENFVHGGKPGVKSELLLEHLQHKLNSTQVVLAAIFDLLFSQCDRHGQNLYLLPDGSISLIDNDQAYGSSWRPCGVDSVFLPGTQKHEVLRLGYKYVLKKPEYAPPKYYRQYADPLQLLDYRCHVPGGMIRTNYPPKVSKCLKKLSRLSPAAIVKKFSYPNLDMAAALHQRANDMLHNGFEWTLKYGWPQNPSPTRYKWSRACCEMQPVTQSNGLPLAKERQYNCTSWRDESAGWHTDLPAGDAALGIGWDHDGKDTGSYNLTQEWAGVQFEQPRT